MRASRWLTTLAVLLCIGLCGNAHARAPDTAGPAELSPVFPFDFRLKDGTSSTIADGAVTRGQIIYRAPVRYRRVGTVRNDIRRTGLVNSNRILVPAGTPVFAMRWGGTTSTDSGLMYGFGYRSVWCAVIHEDPPQATMHTYCMLRSFRGEDLFYSPPGAASYAPAFSTMFLPTPGTAADVVEDPSVDTAFPEMELQISFEGWSHDHPNLNVVLKVGDQETRLHAGDATVGTDGAAVLPVPDALLRLSRGPDGSAIVEREVK